MAKKVLGQSAPAATTLTDLYTVPSAKESTVSTLAVCNRDTVTITYRVAIRPAGAAIANQHYIIKDVSLPAGLSDFLTIGITLAATDVLSVYASTANASFNLFGAEVTA